MTSILSKTHKNSRSFSSGVSRKTKKNQPNYMEIQGKTSDIHKVQITKNTIKEGNYASRHSSKLKVKLDRNISNNIEKVSRKANELRSNYEALNNMFSKEKTRKEKRDQEIFDFANLLKKEQSRNFKMTKDMNESKNKLVKSKEETVSMLKFSKTIRERWNNISETIKLFQETIGDIERGNNKLIEEYAKKCNDLTNTNLLLHQNIQTQIATARNNENKIKELEIMEKYLKEELLEERDKIIEKQQLIDGKKKELDYKLIHDSKHFSDLSSTIESQNINKRKKINSLQLKDKNQVLLEKKINELMGKNELLRQEIYSLNLKLNRPKMPINLIRNKSVSFSSDKRK